MVKKINWRKPIEAVFGDGTAIRSFIVGWTNNETVIVGIPDPVDGKDHGIMVRVDLYGNSLESGKHIVSNVVEAPS